MQDIGIKFFQVLFATYIESLFGKLHFLSPNKILETWEIT